MKELITLTLSREEYNMLVELVKKELGGLQDNRFRYNTFSKEGYPEAYEQQYQEFLKLAEAFGLVKDQAD